MRRANVADDLWQPDSSGNVHVQSKPLTQELNLVDIVIWFNSLSTGKLYYPCFPGIGRDPPSRRLPYRSLSSYITSYWHQHVRLHVTCAWYLHHLGASFIMNYKLVLLHLWILICSFMFRNGIQYFYSWIDSWDWSHFVINLSHKLPQKLTMSLL